MKWLMTILVPLFQVLLTWLAKNAKPTAVDGQLDKEKRDKLRAQIKKHWFKVLIPLFIFLPGCATKTIYVPNGAPVRLRDTVKNAQVWVQDDQGNLVAGRMDLPEGWYCLPLEEDQ